MSVALRVAVALAAIAAAASLALMSLQGSRPQTLDERAQAVAATLKCPVCHDLTVADSPAPVAQQMRKQIRDELAAGRTPDEIRAEFVAAYGDWILVAPPRQGVNWIAWLGPFALAGTGLALLVLALAGWARPRAAAHADAEPDRARLAEVFARLDELEADLE